MPDNITSRVEINLSTGSLVVSGTEEFINESLEKVLDFLKENSFQNDHNNTVTIQKAPMVTTPSTQPSTIDTTLHPVTPNADSSKTEYPSVYKFDSEENISILKDIPGNTKATKARNLALIVLHAISKKEGKEAKIRGSDLVSLCQKHNCYDKNNFSKTFEEQRDFLKEGKSKSQNWTLKLTFEGEKNAKHLLESLRSAESED